MEEEGGEREGGEDEEGVVVGEVDAGSEVVFVEFDSEYLCVGFVEFGFVVVFGSVSSSELFVVGFGMIVGVVRGTSDRGSDSGVVLVEILGLDVGAEAVEEDDWDFEEVEDEG